MNLRSLTPRILLGAMSSAALALLMVILAGSAALEAKQREFDARLASPANIAACQADPGAFGSGQGPGPTVFAYGLDGRSANDAAPPLEPELLPPPGQEPAARVSHPTVGDPLIALRAAGSGPCAIFRVGFDGPPPPKPWQSWPFATLAAASMLAVAGLSYAFTVRPVLRRVSTLAEQAGAIGAPGFHSAGQSDDDDLGRIGRALARSHTRILADRDELLARHRALEEHLASIAHDLRTPLAGLQLSIEELADQARDADGRTVARRAVQDTVYLATLVENLHQAVRLRHGLDAREGQVDLGLLVERVAARFTALGRLEGVEVSASRPDQPLSARCTPALAERALANLVHNAVVHNQPGGHVAVLLERQGDRFTLQVLDDGPGLRPGAIADLQHRTFQSDAARPRGPGMGIAISNEICRRAEWEIRYQPLEPRGLKVEITGALEGETPD